MGEDNTYTITVTESQYKKIIEKVIFDNCETGTQCPSILQIKRVLEIYDGRPLDEISGQTLTDAAFYIKEHWADEK